MKKFSSSCCFHLVSSNTFSSTQILLLLFIKLVLSTHNGSLLAFTPFAQETEDTMQATVKVTNFWM
jgi:hypothetical protein